MCAVGGSRASALFPYCGPHASRVSSLEAQVGDRTVAQVVAEERVCGRRIQIVNKKPTNMSAVRSWITRVQAGTWLSARAVLGREISE